MTPELDTLLRTLEPACEQNLQLRRQFGLACVCRVEHFLEQPEVLDCLQVFRLLLGSPERVSEWPDLVQRSAELANRHPGSKSLDGAGHAAVSASYACAKAVAGQARQASEYAAYAAVYGQGGYGATQDRSAFTPEFQWQAQQLQDMLLAHGLWPTGH